MCRRPPLPLVSQLSGVEAPGLSQVEWVFSKSEVPVLGFLVMPSVWALLMFRCFFWFPLTGQVDALRFVASICSADSDHRWSSGICDNGRSDGESFE